MSLDSLAGLFEEIMQDQYSAETQLIKALPKMADHAKASSLKAAFEKHFEETKEHARRIEQCCDELEIDPSGKTCEAMKGLIAEADQLFKEAKPSAVLDAAMIAAAQKVEHYEMAGYGTLIAHANELGYDNVAQILEMTFAEERAADVKLTEIALGGVNQEAMVGVRRSGAELI